MRKPLLYSSLILWTLSACNKAIPHSDDLLFDVGLLGEWEISSRTANGAPDPTVDCCEYLELRGDSVLEDLISRFKTHKIVFTNLLDGHFLTNNQSTALHIVVVHGMRNERTEIVSIVLDTNFS